MITLNDYLYSGDTVLRILQKYIADLKVEADRNRNEIDRVHCDFLAQIEGMLEHNEFLTAQSQKIRDFYKYMAKEYPYLSFTFKGRIKSLIRAESKFNGYIVEYIYDYYKEHQTYPELEDLKERLVCFRDLIAWMHTALRSGYSMENAVLEAAGQLEQSLGKENILVQELRRMRHKMMISVPVEQLFQDLAVRSRIDDIETFASVLVIAKRTGGNVCEIFQNTWDIFCTRIDTMREIRAGVSSRRFEQNIMSVVPFGILGYVQLSFPEFLSVMYGNVIGVFFMSGCLAVYLTAWVLGKKILDIEF